MTFYCLFTTVKCFHNYFVQHTETLHCITDSGRPRWGTVNKGDYGCGGLPTLTLFLPGYVHLHRWTHMCTKQEESCHMRSQMYLHSVCYHWDLECLPKSMYEDLVSSLALLEVAQKVKTYGLLVGFSSQELYPVGDCGNSAPLPPHLPEWTLCCTRSRGAVCLHSKDLEPQDSQDKPFSSPANFLLASCADGKLTTTSIDWMIRVLIPLNKLLCYDYSPCT